MKRNAPSLVLLLVAVLVAGCTGARPLKDDGRAQVRLVRVEELADRLGLEVSPDSSPGMVILSGARGVVVFRPPVILVNSLPCFRDHRTVIRGDRASIPRDFVATCEKYLRPRGPAESESHPEQDAPAKQADPPPPRFHVCIDPGHGGRDPGAVCPLGYEKTVNLAVARLVAARLRKRDIQVTMTRADDRFIPLNGRPAVANRLQADAFVSIHADAATNHNVRGFTVYVGAEDNARYSDAARALAICSECGLDQFQLRPILARNRPRSRRLAAAVRRHLARATDSPDRGTRAAEFRVLERCACPAVLIELGFLTNAGEARQLFRSSYQRDLADAIADGIAHFLRAGARPADRASGRSLPGAGETEGSVTRVQAAARRAPRSSPAP